MVNSELTLLKRIQSFLHNNLNVVPILVLGVAVAFFGILAGDRFFSPFNLSLIIQQVSIIGILGIAQTLIVLTAGIDLSVAAVMVLSSVIMGKLSIHLGIPVPLSILIGILVAALCGAVNGFLVAKAKLPPFIVTLGTWSIFFALNLWYSGSQSIRSQDLDEQASLLKFFGGKIEIFNTSFTYGSVFFILLFIVFWYILKHTSWGTHIYAVGDNPDAAQLAGINSSKVLFSVYVVAGVICGLGAWSSIGRVGSISPQSFYEGNLESITAVVIGGTSLFGGRGSIIGTFFGALIVGVFRSGLALSGIDVLWQVFAIGWLIIIAVLLDQWIRKIGN